MSSVVAVVKSVIGQVLAVSAEGQRRVLVEGDRLFLGDLVQTGDAGAVALQLPDGRVLDLGRDSQLSASELAPHAPAQPAVTASAEELQKAIAAGADPTQTLAPTAAGPSASAGGSGPAGGGHSFVLLEETGGHVDPSIGYTTSGPGAAGQGDGERQQEQAPNLAPSFVDDQGNALAGLQLSTAEDTLLQGAFQARDPNGDSLTYSLARGPANGSLIVNADGTWQYLPNPDYNGADSFVVTVTDNRGASSSLTVDIGVSAVNDAPVASGSYGATLVDTAANDSFADIKGQLQASDVDGDQLTWSGSAKGAFGQLTVNPDGSYVYVVDAAAVNALPAGQHPQDSFTVTVRDPSGASDTRVIDIDIQGANDTPQASNAQAQATEDGQLTGQIAASDPDTGSSLTFSVDGKAPAGFTLQPDGNWSFDGKDPAYQHLGEGQTQVIVVPVVVTDDQGASSSSTLTITVTGTNDAPVAQAGSATTAENDVLNGQVPAASDVDGSIAGYQLANGVGTGNGTLTFNSDGSYSFDPGQDFDSLPAGVSRDVTFTYQAKDDSGALSDPQTITITVTGTNDAPVAQATNAAVNEDSQINGQLQASDADQGAQLQFGSDSPLPAGFTLGQDGKWSFDASDAAYQHLAAGQTQVISIPYLVTDDQGAVAGNTLTITVTGTNDVPVAQAASAAADEDQVSTGQLTATDADDGAVLTFGVDGNAPAGFTLKADGSWTFDGKDPAYQHLANGETQVISIPVIVTDDQGANATSTLTLTITGTNDAPVAQADSATTGENGVLNGQVPAASDVDGSIVGYQLTNDVGTGNGTLTFNPDGSYSFDPGQDFDSLPAGVSRDVTFTYLAKDDSGALSDPQTITITVTGSNDVPVAQAASAAVNEDSQINGQLQASDADQGAQLQFGSDSPLPAGFTLDQDGKWTFDASDAAYQHLAEGQTQVINIPYLVTDDQGAVAGNTLTITLTGTNDAPIAQASSAAADEDQVSTGQLTATDADDGAVLTFSIDGNAPAGFTLKTDGSWTFDGKDSAYQHLADGETQVISVPVLVTDEHGATSSSTLSITVTGTNDAPVAQAGSATTAENDVLNGQVPAASDVDGSIAGYQLANGVGTGNGTLTFNSDGSYSFDPGQDFDSLPAGVSRDVSFTYQAKDDSGALSDPQTITITVTGSNDAPVAQATNAAVNEDSQINGQLQASDADQGAQLQFGSDSPLPAGFTLGQDGKWSFDASDAAYQHLAAGQTQVISIPVVVTDDQGATSGSTLTITVTGTNDVPVAQAASAAVDEDQVSTGQLTASDADDGAVLTFSVDGNVPAGFTLKTDGSWSFDGKDPAYQHLADGETQVISIPVIVTDEHGATDTSTLTLTITGTNDAPVALAGSATTAENDVLNGQVPAASDVDGTIAGYQLASGVGTGNGTLTFNSDGSYRFDPGQDFDSLPAGVSRDITFTYQAQDDSGALSAPQTITITVTGTNDAPVAQAGSAATEENTVLNGQVPAASDVDGTIAGYQLATDVGTGNGTLTFNPNGGYSFDPGQDFDSLPAGVSRDVTFTYQAKDDSGALSAPQTITITVTGTNDAPIAQAGSAATEENTILNGQVPAASDVDGTIASYQLATDVGTGNGTLTFNSNGGYTFDPGHDFDSLPAGVSRDVTFTYQAKDDSGALSAPQTITITVTGTNDAPIAQAGSAATEENTILNGQVPAASDVDGTIASYQLTTDVGTGNGTLTFNSNGGYSFDPGHDFDSLPAGVSRDVTFTYQAKDDSGALSAPQAITITVTGTNDAPVAQAATAAVNEDSQINGQLQATDADQGAQLQFGSDSPLPAGFTLDQDGKWTFDASNPAYQHLAAGQTQVISIPVVVTDDQGATSGSTLTITVTGTNDAPVVQAASAAADEDQVSTGQLTATDADDGAVLTFSIDGNAPAGFILQSDGSWTFDGKDPAYQHLANDETQVISIPVIVTDDQGATSSSTLTLTITGTNDAPVAQAGSATTGENTVLNSQVPAASDVDGTIAGYQLTTDVGTGNGTLTFNPNGGYSFDPGQDFDSLPAGVSRDVTFTYQAKDDSGALSAPQTITITVTGTNDAPVAQAGSATTEENTILDGQVPAASDVDGTIASYQLTTDVGTGNGTLTFHGDGSYTFDPGQDFDSLPVGVSRDVTFTYQAQDDSGALSAPQTITITVTGTNDAAVITGAQVSINETNAPITTGGQLTITDVDSPATFIEQTNVAGQYGHFNLAADGTWSYTADSAYNQLSVGQSLTDTFTVTSADGTTSSVSVTIDGTNDAAVITGAQVHINETNAPISTGGQLTVTDVDSPATFIEQTNVAGQYGHFNLAADGTWSYTADSAYNQLSVGQSLTDTFTVTSADGTTSSVSVTIDGTNDAAIITGAQVSINETNAPISTGGQLTVTDVDSPATFIEQTNVAGQYGHFTLAADGTWSYTADSAYNELKLNETLTDTFTVQSADGTQSSVTVNIVGSNDAPVAQAASASAVEGGSLQPGVVAGATDGSALTLTITTTQPGEAISFNWTFTTQDYAPYNDFAFVQVNGQVVTLLSSVAAVGDYGTSGPQTFSHTFDQPGTYTLVIGVADSGDSSIDSTLVLSNLPPQASVVGSVGQAVQGSSGWTLTNNGANNQALVDQLKPVSEITGQLQASDVDHGAQLSYSVDGAAPAGFTLHSDGSWVFDAKDAAYDSLAANQVKVLQIGFTVTDEHGATGSSTLTLTITGTNDAPVANADQALTPINVALPSIDVLGNDSDVDGDTLSVTKAVLADPSQGSVSINPDGTLNFVPAENLSGSVVIHYEISDSHGASASSSLTVQVGGNTPPQGADGSASLDEDSSHSFSAADFAFNDADAGQHLQAVRIDSLPGAGSLTFDGVAVVPGQVIAAADLGKLKFTPDADDNGAPYASFGFSVQDSAGAFDSASHTFTLDVTPVDDPSVLLPDVASMDEDDGSVTGNVLANDSDVDDTLSVSSYSVAGFSGNIAAGTGTTIVGVGSIVIDANGHYSFTPDANYHGAVPQITYTTNTGASSTLDITVNSVNDLPVAENANKSTLEDTPVSGQVVASDVDGDALTYTLKPSSGPANGTLVLDAATGHYTYTPNPNYNGPDSFTVVIDDGHNGTAESTVTLTVTAVNDVPVTSDDSKTTAEDTAVSGQVVASDVDGDALTYTLKPSSGPANGTLVLDTATGHYTYTPNPNYNGPDSFTVVIDDGHNGTTESTVSLTVTAVNDAPVTTDDSKTTAEDTAVSGQVVASDVDGDALTYTLKSGDEPKHGTLVLDAATGHYTYTPNPNYNGSDSFTVVIDDGHNGTAESTVSLSVTPVNDAPVAANDSKTTGENSVLSDQVPAASDIDSPVNPNGYALVSGPGAGNGLLTFNSDGSYVFNPGSDFDSLAPGESHQVSFTYTAKDSEGATSAPATVTITVTGANDAPTGSDGTITLDEDSSRSFSAIDFGFNDVDHNDALGAVRIDSLPGAGSLTFDGAAVTQGQVIAAADLGKLAFTPAANANGNNYASFTFSVKDSNGAFDSTPNKLTVNVTPVNDNPVAVNDHYLVGGLQGNYWGYREGTDGNNLTSLSMISAFIAKTAPSATFTATALNYGNGVSTDLGGDKQLQKFLGSDAASLSTDPANTSDAIVQLTGLVNLAAGNYTFRVTADDGFSIRIDGVEVFKYDANQSPTARVSDSFNIAQGGNHQIEILYWDQGGNAQLKVELAPVGGSYSVLGGSSLSHPLAELVTNEDTALTIAANTLLGNDSDVDGDSLSILSVQGAVNGTVKLENGNVVFTPAKDVNGTGSFTYTVSDGHGGTSTATVTVGINAVNDAPVAKPDSASTQEDKPVTLNVLANDSDVDGDALSVTSASASNGSVTVNADGTLTYTPKANFSGSDSITYTISDGHGGTASSTVAVSVTPVADVPLLNSGSIFALNPGATSISTTQGITQANLETETGLSSGALDGINPPSGALTHNANVNVVDGSLTSSDYTLKAGTQVNFAWTFTNGENSSSEISNGFNDIVALVVTGPDGTRTLIQVTSSEQRGASVNGSGVQSYTASSSGNYHFDWLVLNGGDADKDSSLSLGAPTFTLGGKTYGAPINVGINAALSDTDGSESLSVKITGVPNDATFTSGTHNADGSWSFTQAQLHDLQLLPASGYNGTLTLGVTAIATESDGSTASATQTLSITVASTNSSGNDLLHGYGTNSGNSTTDTLNGGDGHDILYGGAGNSILNGGDGNDTLYGGLGNDTLDGGKGNDLLVGGKGNDTLTGGDGADTFIWRAGDTGNDTITDFKPGDGDRIDLVDLLPDAAHNDILSYLKVDTATSTLQISTTGQVNSSTDVTIKLTGVDLKTYGATSADIVKSLVAGADPLVKTEHH